MWSRILDNEKLLSHWWAVKPWQKKKPLWIINIIYILYVGRDSSVDIATGYELDGPGDGIPVGARFSAPVQTGPGAHPTSCTMGTGSFPGVKSGRGVTLTPHPLLVPWSWKSRAIPLLPLWAVRPVQSLSACTRVHFTFYVTIHFASDRLHRHALCSVLQDYSNVHIFQQPINIRF